MAAKPVGVGELRAKLSEHPQGTAPALHAGAERQPGRAVAALAAAHRRRPGAPAHQSQLVRINLASGAQTTLARDRLNAVTGLH